jgi:serine/threonine protein kinase
VSPDPSPQSDPPSAEPGRLGEYELHQPLGRGGMAETFVARRVGPGGFDQRVCIKRVLPLFRDDEEFVRLFLEEARLTAGLAHVNVVQVVDSGEEAGCPFLVLELVRGVDLRRLIRNRDGRTLTAGVVSHLAHELAAALEHAHGDHVVHRDISPSNVLISVAGEVKLTDFGIAKALASPRYTHTRVVKGKVPYMAPEYGREGRFDARSDLYALGVTLYEAAAGRRPYQGRNEVETLELALAGDHPPLTEVAPGIGPELAELVHRLIRPLPEDRFPSAAALLDALEELPPPPTARRILADRAIAEQPREGAESPDGTLRLEGTERSRLEGIPESAAPDAETRTRAPLGAGPTGTRTELGGLSEPGAEPPPPGPGGGALLFVGLAMLGVAIATVALFYAC